MPPSNILKKKKKHVNKKRKTNIYKKKKNAIVDEIEKKY
jgi:hypothetical protein